MVTGEELLTLEDGKSTLPSVVFFNADDDDVTFGRAALADYLAGYEGRLMRSLKSLLGTPLMDGQTEVAGRALSFRELLGQFIRELKRRGESAAGREFDAAVFGRPVHFVDDDPVADRLAQDTLADIAMYYYEKDLNDLLIDQVPKNKYDWQRWTAAVKLPFMLSGLLGNIGFKLEDDEAYLGARGIKFYRHPGAHLKKRPGRWVVCAELVETTRLFGRGIANIEPQWVEEVAGHLLKKQLLDPHWEKKAAEVVSLERATLYGLVIYSGRRVPFARVDAQGAREIFIREGLVAGQWETRLPFLAANQKLVGPSWADVAKKHQGKADYLAGKIRSGGTGVRSAYPDRRIWAIFEPRSATSCRRIFQDEFALGSDKVLHRGLAQQLHRRLLDVIKDEFDRRGRADINSVQALLLYNIGDKELTAGELRTRGYYLGSNVSYNLKKLVEMGFLDHQRSRVDRRSVRIKLTEKGQETLNVLDSTYEHLLGEMVNLLDADELSMFRDNSRMMLDMVEREARRLEPAGAGLRGAGEGTRFMPEQFRIDQRFAEGAAIDGDEGAGPFALRMDVAGNEFLAGTGLADDEHGGIAARHPFHLLEQCKGTGIVE